MTLSTWLTVVVICALGAMSPGPSLALIVKHTAAGGRRQGILTGLAHGAGIGCYAVLSVAGIAALLVASPRLFEGLQWLGAIYLFWLGVSGLRAAHQQHPQPAQRLHQITRGSALRDGFLMALLNPKTALFFLALFSQVVSPSTSLAGKLGYAVTAMLIDMGWYSSVVWLLSRPGWLQRLERNAQRIDRIFGVILIGLALFILVEII